MNKMFNFNGMQYKRSGHAGGKSVSMVSVLVLLLAALLVLPSCFDGDTETVTETETQCYDGDTAAPGETCPDPPGPPDPEIMTEIHTQCLDGTTAGPGQTCLDPVEMCEEGTAEADDLEGSSFEDYICGLGGGDTITAGAGNDTLSGGPGNDTLRGGAGNDMIKGDAGDDKLYSGAGDDRLYGGEGDDELIVQGGDNMLDGGTDMDGEDMDIAIYLETGGVRANLASNSAKHLPAPATVSGDPFAAPGGGEDTLMNIENVKGSHMPDILIGDGENNILKGLDGADNIAGGAGDDTIIPNRPMPPATVGDPPDALAEGETTPADGIDTINGGGRRR